MPVVIAGNKEQQKKYLGRLIDEPLVAVSSFFPHYTLILLFFYNNKTNFINSD